MLNTTGCILLEADDIRNILFFLGVLAGSESWGNLDENQQVILDNIIYNLYGE